jgi:phosphoribosylaminoimidazolecarboxamide formyltransferase/IMP cyclohydrolase
MAADSANAPEPGVTEVTDPAAPPLLERALISVSDKRGIAELARALAEAEIEIISTGSSAEAIREAGSPVTDVSDVTGFAEMMDGRVKTLHPAIHAGILADRDNREHQEVLTRHDIEPIDLVVANLYPFTEAVAAGLGDASVIEHVDIGGPTLVRAAAKNVDFVTVVVDPDDYPAVVEAVSLGGVDATTRRRLAAKAFAHTADYEAAVARWFAGADGRGTSAGAGQAQSGAEATRAAADGEFPQLYAPSFRLQRSLRYGENPHQQAAFYVADGRPEGLADARQLGGKELSYNNLLDTDAAWGMAGDFAEPCVAIVKHANPAGLAVAEQLADAYPPALAGDPVSAFGGIVAVNRPMDGETARQLVEVFTEVVAAPDYTDEALEVLQAKQSLRILALGPPRQPEGLESRSVHGGLLAQHPDTAAEDENGWSVPTAAQPDEATRRELAFAWRTAKHTRSNAIVLTRDRAVVGVGAGQMSRVDSVRIALEKANGRGLGAALASDAFFPFRDGPDVALEAGVGAIVQPGGSVRDEEVVAACDERGVPMVATGRRHFRH